MPSKLTLGTKSDADEGKQRRYSGQHFRIHSMGAPLFLVCFLGDFLPCQYRTRSLTAIAGVRAWRMSTDRDSISRTSEKCALLFVPLRERCACFPNEFGEPIGIQRTFIPSMHSLAPLSATLFIQSTAFRN